ncbi:MAG: hypothetical protein AB7S75_09610 [Desulfococcaceae bacterium]
MTFDEIKNAILNLSDADQKKLITDVIPAIWGKACTDDTCVLEMRKLVDEDMIKNYRKQHMNGI